MLSRWLPCEQALMSTDDARVAGEDFSWPSCCVEPYAPSVSISVTVAQLAGHAQPISMYLALRSALTASTLAFSAESVSGTSAYQQRADKHCRPLREGRTFYKACLQTSGRKLLYWQ